MKPGDKNPGTVTTLVNHMQRGIKRGHVSVPCGSCNACCRSPHIAVGLMSDEVDAFPDAVWRPQAPGAKYHSGWTLPKQEDGRCKYLIDEKCSIYHRRPTICRTYDCRIHLLIGSYSRNDPVLNEGIFHWAKLQMPTIKDRDLLAALRMAVVHNGMPHDEGEALRKMNNASKFLPMAQELRRTYDRLSETEKKDLHKRYDPLWETGAYDGKQSA